MRSRGSRWWRRAAGLALGCTLALLLAEGLLRLLGLPDTNRLFLMTPTFAEVKFRADPELFWLMSPEHPECNEHGLRGPWCDGARADNELRLLAVGDSCTFGYGVAWQEGYAVQLERRLQAAHPDRVVRSALAALPGWSTFQDRRLLDRVLPATAPDVVVFYCGSWNDFMPAVGADDAAIAARLEASRLLALLQGAMAPDADACMQAFLRGEAPYGRRVAPSAFTTNLEHMVAACLGAGARVVLVVPSHPPDTTARCPALALYRERVVAAARRFDLPVVDLADVVQQLDPDGAPALPGEATACFLDWVHPTASLHAALAAALASALAVPAAAPAPASPPLLPPAAGRELVVALPPASTGRMQRLWLGDVPVAGAHRGPGGLHVPLPVELPPGEHVLELVDAGGRHVLGRYDVAAPGLHPTVERLGGGVRVTFRGEGPPGRLVWLWTTRSVTPRPVPTPFGPFGLDVPALARPVAGVVRFDLASDGRHQAIVAADGSWSLQVELPAAAGASPAFAQALVLDPRTRRGALTGVARIDPPAGR